MVPCVFVQLVPHLQEPHTRCNTKCSEHHTLQPANTTFISANLAVQCYCLFCDVSTTCSYDTRLPRHSHRFTFQIIDFFFIITLFSTCSDHIVCRVYWPAAVDSITDTISFCVSILSCAIVMYTASTPTSTDSKCAYRLYLWCLQTVLLMHAVSRVLSMTIKDGHRQSRDIYRQLLWCLQTVLAISIDSSCEAYRQYLRYL